MLSRLSKLNTIIHLSFYKKYQKASKIFVELPASITLAKRSPRSQKQLGI
jgi:hypothetical protein